VQAQMRGGRTQQKGMTRTAKSRHNRHKVERTVYCKQGARGGMRGRQRDVRLMVVNVEILKRKVNKREGRKMCSRVLGVGCVVSSWSLP